MIANVAPVSVSIKKEFLRQRNWKEQKRKTAELATNPISGINIT
jgi:hypothetical protein